MKIAIIGTRGIPNNYGGFEQCASYLSKGLVQKGFDVTVYNSHNHPYKDSTWHGVKIVHKYDPEHKIGTAGQFIYDFNCIMDARKKKFDIILQLGYTSSSIWGRLLPKTSIITTNMDGLEWKRDKYSKIVQRFLLFAEKLGVKYSDHLISDSKGIQKYLMKKYSVGSTFIPYGANLFTIINEKVLSVYDVSAYKYDLLIARLEPENSIETILDGVKLSNSSRKILVVGPHKTKFGEYLKERYKDTNNIIFIGGIYETHILNNLRYFANIYFHGHTVGGTNPSLLEAMASSCYICSNDNIFNRAILGKDALYFKTSTDIANHLNTKIDINYRMQIIENNLIKIRNEYSWETIVNSYANHFYEIIETERSRLKSRKDIVKPMIADPPLFIGATNVTDALASPEVATTEVGAPEMIRL